MNGAPEQDSHHVHLFGFANMTRFYHHHCDSYPRHRGELCGDRAEDAMARNNKQHSTLTSPGENRSSAQKGLGIYARDRTALQTAVPHGHSQVEV